MTTNYFEELCSQLNIDWSDIENNDLYTETELVRWLDLGKEEATARYPWPFTEGREEITSVSAKEKYDYPTNVKSDSIRYLTVNDKRYEKLLFEDYLKYREDYDSGTKKYFSDQARVIYINYLADDFGNSIVVYAQVQVAGTIDSTTTTSVFSMAEPEGDDAIVKLAKAKAFASEKMKKPTEARQERLEAFEILDTIWQRIKGKQHTYKTKDTPLFKRINIIKGSYEDNLRKRNQF